MKILQKICFVLLMTTFSIVYAVDCFEGLDMNIASLSDVDDFDSC